jgi:hypothetical protein
MDVEEGLVSRLVEASEGKIVSIVLDQWRTRDGQWGLTYGYGSCDNNCKTCGVYVAANLPEIRSDFPLRTYHVLATDGDRENYGGERFLNCKTIEEYARSYVVCFISGHALDSIEEELSYVANFKLLYLKGVSDLEKAEREIKKKIVDEVAKTCDDKEIFLEKAKGFGLI